MSGHLPRALRTLHYKCVNVTTLNELARRFWPQLHHEVPGKREVHRAMPDIEDSLALCRYYATTPRRSGCPPKLNGPCP